MPRASLRRRDELQRRLAQLADDIRREEQHVADNAGILARLDEEEAVLLDTLADADDRAVEAQERPAVMSARNWPKASASQPSDSRARRSAGGRNQLERPSAILPSARAGLSRQLGDRPRTRRRSTGRSPVCRIRRQNARRSRLPKRRWRMPMAQSCPWRKRLPLPAGRKPRPARRSMPPARS